VSICVLSIDVAVVVYKVVAARVVGRIDVDDVHLAGMGVVEHREGVVVVTLDDQVRRLAGSCLDGAVGDLLEHGELTGTLLDDILRLVLPHEAKLLPASEILDERDKLVLRVLLERAFQ
jgi:hypothetical protein